MSTISADHIAAIDCGNIRFTVQAVAEVSRGRAYHSIARSEIQTLACRYGRLSVQPVVPIGFGLLLCVIGAAFVLNFLIWNAEGGRIIDWEIYLIWILPLGLWLIIDALRRGYYLEVVTARTQYRLAFGKHVSPEIIRACAREVDRIFGYSLEVAVETWA